MGITKAVLIFTILTLSVCALPAQTATPLRSAGKEFWLCYPTNDPFNATPANLYVYVTADSTATVQTTMIAKTTYRVPLGKSWGFVPAHDTVITRTDIVQPGAPLTIQVDTVNNLSQNGVPLPYSVHVTSNAPVRVFTLSHKIYTSDGVTALPVSLCDTSYVLAAQKNDVAGYTTYASEAEFIATQDNTTIRVYPTAQLMPAEAYPYVITLNRGQVVQIKADTSNKPGDLTGTEVFSNKPIVAVSGVERAWIFSDGNGFPSRDHMIEQMLPVKYLGRSYLATQTAQGISPNRIKAVAPFDSTFVTINDTTYTLQHRQFIDVGITGPQALYATKPVCVVEEEPSSNSAVGDPDMELVPPLRGYDTSYRVFFPVVVDTAYVYDTVTFADSTWQRDTTVSNVNKRVRDTVTTLDSAFGGNVLEYDKRTSYLDTTYLGDSVSIHNMTQYRIYDISQPVFFNMYITAIMRTEDVPFFLLNGIHPNENLFKQTTYCDYSVVTLDVPQPGQYVVSAPHGFWCMFYGYGYTDSYGYIAGVRIVPDDSLVSGALDFGKLRAKKTKDSLTIIQNTGSNPINIIGATIIGKDSTVFHLLYDSVPRMLNGSDTMAFRIEFAPPRAGNYSAYLQICTDENIVLVPLTGVGIAAHLALVPPVTNWGLRLAGSRYDSTVVLENVGNDSANVTGEDIIGGDTTNFSIRSVAMELHAGAKVTLGVNYHPRLTGSYAKDIEALSDSPDSSVTAQLLGIATGATLLVDSINYGTRLLGSPANGFAFITNVSGNLTVQIDSLDIYGQDRRQFAIVAPLNNTFPKYLPPGDTLWVNVRFNASVAGPAQAYINVFTALPCDVILLTGNVKDIIAPQLTNLAMRPVCVDAGADTLVTFSNLGTSPLGVTSIASSDPATFTVLNEPSYPVTVMPDSSLSISLHITPHKGAESVTLMVTYEHNADSLRTISSTINVFGLWDSSTAASHISSSAVTLGDTGRYCFMFYNNGNEPLTVDSVLFADNAHFIPSAALPLVLAAGDSVCLPYRFIPAHDDTVQTTVSVDCHAACGSDSSQADISAVGAAVHAQIDSIDFSSIYSCTDHNGVLTLRNTSGINGTIDTVAIRGAAPPFSLSVQTPIAFPADTTVTIPVRFFPTAAGNYTADVSVGYSPRDPALPPLTAVLKGVAQPFPLNAEIDTAYHGLPGKPATIFMTITTGLSQLQLHAVRGVIHFNQKVLHITGYSFAGSALDGFTADTFAIDNAAGVITFRAHDDAGVIADDSLLLAITGVVLAGDTNKTMLADTVEFPDGGGACVAVTNIAGLFTADSICGLSRVDYAEPAQLLQNSPNPFSGETDIRFIVGTKERVTITLYDPLGREVQTIADGEYEQGSYMAALAAGNLPAGLYYYRMTAGSFVSTKELTIIK